MSQRACWPPAHLSTPQARIPSRVSHIPTTGEAYKSASSWQHRRSACPLVGSTPDGLALAPRMPLPAARHRRWSTICLSAMTAQPIRRCKIHRTPRPEHRYRSCAPSLYTHALPGSTRVPPADDCSRRADILTTLQNTLATRADACCPGRRTPSAARREPTWDEPDVAASAEWIDSPETSIPFSPQRGFIGLVVYRARVETKYMASTWLGSEDTRHSSGPRPNRQSTPEKCMS
ncbi:hypothetical protein FB451DRAFT_1391947 [Mycena latifolia]|nr:hypothetical protein FB451DRAFT_1391947 [Mycena latifolia]